MGGSESRSRPPASSEGARRRLAAQARRDTRPERALRAVLHRAGLRYRVDTTPLPGLRRRADVVFPRARVAVFVDGCFWHRCPLHGTEAKANREWWTAKLDRNVARDRETDRLLQSMGWHVLRLWEHDSPEQGLAAVLTALGRADHVEDTTA